VFDRDRNFLGYRGFGVFREAIPFIAKAKPVALANETTVHEPAALAEIPEVISPPAEDAGLPSHVVAKDRDIETAHEETSAQETSPHEEVSLAQKIEAEHVTPAALLEEKLSEAAATDETEETAANDEFPLPHEIAEEHGATALIEEKLSETTSEDETEETAANDEFPLPHEPAEFEALRAAAQAAMNGTMAPSEGSEDAPLTEPEPETETETASLAAIDESDAAPRDVQDQETQDRKALTPKEQVAFREIGRVLLQDTLEHERAGVLRDLDRAMNPQSLRAESQTEAETQSPEHETPSEPMLAATPRSHWGQRTRADGPHSARHRGASRREAALREPRAARLGRLRKSGSAGARGRPAPRVLDRAPRRRRSDRFARARHARPERRTDPGRDALVLDAVVRQGRARLRASPRQRRLRREAREHGALAPRGGSRHARPAGNSRHRDRRRADHRPRRQNSRHEQIRGSAVQLRFRGSAGRLLHHAVRAGKPPRGGRLSRQARLERRRQHPQRRPRSGGARAERRPYSAVHEPRQGRRRRPEILHGLTRHHAMEARRRGIDQRPPPGRNRKLPQVRLPRQDQPRDAHALERHHRLCRGDDRRAFRPDRFGALSRLSEGHSPVPART
jgi:hypothetical protein